MNLSTEKFLDNYPAEILISIWKEGAEKAEEYGRKRIEWAFLGNPLGKARLWLLKDEEKGNYFGCSALLPRYFLIKGEKARGALIADTAIKKEYRSLGPALFLHQEIIKDSTDLAFILAFPNRVAQAVIERVGFKRAKSLAHYIKIIKSRQAIRQKIKVRFLAAFLAFFAPVIDLVIKVIDFRWPSKKEFVFNLEDVFSEKFDKIWIKFMSKYRFILERDSTYLKWRYRNNPNLRKDYKIFSVYSKPENELVGYLIYFMENGFAYVDEFVWIEEQINLENLLSLFGNAMRRISVEAIRFAFMEDSLIEKSFRKNMYFRIGTSPLLYYVLDKSMAQDLAVFLDGHGAFITSGDRDF